MTKPKVCIPGVYVITNTVSGKFYIGSSNHVPARINDHKRDLAKGEHCNSYLQAAYDKYGVEAFEYNIMELCTEDEVLAVEQSYLDRYWDYGILYNLNPKAHSGAGRVVTEETRAKMRAWVRPEVSAETKAKMSASGKKRRATEETKEKMRAARKLVDPDCYKRGAAKQKGQKRQFSPEGLEALRKSNKAKKSNYTDEEWAAIQEKRRQTTARNRAAKQKELENGNHT